MSICLLSSDLHPLFYWLLHRPCATQNSVTIATHRSDVFMANRGLVNINIVHIDEKWIRWVLVSAGWWSDLVRLLYDFWNFTLCSVRLKSIKCAWRTDENGFSRWTVSANWFLTWIKFHVMLHLFHFWLASFGPTKSYFHYLTGSFIRMASILDWHFHHKLHA